MTGDREGDRVYCTWAHRAMLPADIRGKFGDLDQFLRTIIGSARTSLLIISPYLSAAGLQSLKAPMEVAVSNGAWLRIVTGDLAADNERNRQALQRLVENSDGQRIRGRLRVLVATESLPVLIHAKSIIADRSSGFLGSANLSWRGLDSNFEMGVALGYRQAETIDSLVSYLEARGMIADATSSALAT